MEKLRSLCVLELELEVAASTLLQFEVVLFDDFIDFGLDLDELRLLVFFALL